MLADLARFLLQLDFIRKYTEKGLEKIQEPD